MRNIEITYKNRFSSNSHFPHIHMNMECGYDFEFMKYIYENVKWLWLLSCGMVRGSVELWIT